MSSTRAISGLVVILNVLLFLVHWMPSGMSLRQLQRCMRRIRDAVPFAGRFVAKSTSLTSLLVGEAKKRNDSAASEPDFALFVIQICSGVHRSSSGVH